jgi:non-ribosomal peptide synthetase component F/thioesterase domain-containing protein/acyl carrier protein
MRVAIDPDLPFTELLGKIRESFLDAQEHWNYGFGKLVQKLDVPTDPSRIPLVSVIINLDVAMDRIKFAGCNVEIHAVPRRYFQYDLGFNMVDEGTSLLIECDYNTNLFDDATIDAWLKHFLQLLRAVIAHHDQPAALLPVHFAPDNAFFRSAPDAAVEVAPDTALEMIAAQIAANPAKVAVESAAGSLTYADLDRRANQAAATLQSAGSDAASPVAVFCDRDQHLPVALLGVMRAGSAYQLVDPARSDEQVAMQLKAGGAKLVLTRASLQTRLKDSGLRIVLLDSATSAQPARAITVRPTDVACVAIVDDPGGHPLSVELPHSAVANFLQGARKQPGLAPDDIVLAANALTSDFSLVEILLPLAAGASVVIPARAGLTSPAYFESLLDRHRITVVPAAAPSWRALFNAGWTGRASLKAICVGAVPPADLVEKLARGCREAWGLYGTAETATGAFVTRFAPGTAPKLGRPLAGNAGYVVDERLQPVPIGAPGELLVNGANLARGYRAAGEANDTRFATIAPATRCYRTGELVRFLPNGELEYVGSRAERIALRGHRIHLREIEAILLQHEDVMDAMVAVREDAGRPAVLVAYLVGSARAVGAVDEFRQELRSWLRRRVPEYMVPAGYVLLKELPYSARGRSERALLPVPNEDAFQQAETFVAPRSDTEKKLARIWADALKLEQIGIRQSFFELGGQSLMAVSLFAQIEKEFGRRLPLATLLRAPTIEQLANELDGKTVTPAGGWPSLAPIQTGGNGPRLFLVHGAGGNVLLYRSLGQHLAPAVQLYGLQSQGLDGISKPLYSMEEMATRYIRELRAVQPSGPYFLGGYCLGGNIAYEMAQQLSQAGEEVALVAMLDTYNWHLIVATDTFGTRMARMAELVKFHSVNIARLSPREIPGYLGEKIRMTIEYAQNRVKSLFGRKQTTDRDQETIVFVHAANDIAAENYRPKPYHGRVTLVKPTVNYKSYSDPNMGWGDLTLGGLEIVELPVMPHAMLVEPYVKHLAAQLKRLIVGAPAASPMPKETRVPETANSR